MAKITFRDANVTIFQSALYQTNSTVVRTDDAVIIIDPGLLPDEVMDIKHYVDGIKGNRQIYLMFTHSDYDHIIGYKAFTPDKVFTSKAMAENPNKELAVEQALDFDDKYYISRPYPIEYPESNFQVFRDGVQYRHGNTKLTFYNAPGHTPDGMMIVIWQLGLCLSGDYLSNIEFPFIQNSTEYIETLDKLSKIHDRNWFTRLVPGHGDPAMTINDWLQRRTEGLAYIYALRESIANDIPFDEVSLWTRYTFSRNLRQAHIDNIAVVTKEYETGLWAWDPKFSMDDIAMPYDSDASTLVFESETE